MVISYRWFFFLSLLLNSYVIGHKPKPKPKPKPIIDSSSNVTTNTTFQCPDVDGTGYCGALQAISGEYCGSYGISDTSYCAADTAGTPHCFALNWCDSNLVACTCTSDCGAYEACLLSCWSYPVCTPLCGNPNLPVAPSLDDAPYYDSGTSTCLTELDASIEVPLISDYLSASDRETTYSAYMKRNGLTPTTSSPSSTSLFTSINIAAVSVVLMVLLIVSIRKYILQSESQQNQFTELSTSSDHLGTLELEERKSLKTEIVTL